jgi:hypothetical protein
MSTCHRERRRELREAAIKVLLADKRMRGEGGIFANLGQNRKVLSNFVRDLCQPALCQNIEK